MKYVVVVPTFNEAENVEPFVHRLRQHQPVIDVVFVDDSSPDGTGDIVRRMALSDPHLHLLIRDARRGYAAACRDGFAWCLANGSEAVVTMDCDLSHDPASIAVLLARADGGADLVIGSRYVKGGRVDNWPLHRRLLSRWGNRYTAAMLRIPFTDCTSGFRVYRRDCLEAVGAARSSAEGYAFLTEMLRLVTSDPRWSATETPIVFTDRTRGRSKMSASIVLESIVLVTRWGVALRLRGRRHPRRRPVR